MILSSDLCSKRSKAVFVGNRNDLYGIHSDSWTDKFRSLYIDCKNVIHLFQYRCTFQHNNVRLINTYIPIYIYIYIYMYNQTCLCINWDKDSFPDVEFSQTNATAHWTFPGCCTRYHYYFFVFTPIIYFAYVLLKCYFSKIQRVFKRAKPRRASHGISKMPISCHVSNSHGLLSWLDNASRFLIMNISQCNI